MSAILFPHRFDLARQLSRIDLALLSPRFYAKVCYLLKNCADRGALYFAIEGYRTRARQAFLYAQGRTTSGRIVTMAPPGFSAHERGEAIDFALDLNSDPKDGLQPDWDPDHYKILAEEALELGLEPGLYWRSFPEGPHVQLPHVA